MRNYRKLTTNAEIRRKFAINMIIFMICAIGFGYAYLNTDMGIHGEIAVSRLKVTCSEGTYLSHASKSCSNCTAGSFCPGNTFSYHPLDNQGIITCPVGSYSLAVASSCTVCTNGKTTTSIGSTSCDSDCTNAAGASTWLSPSINGAEITNLCVIDTCRSGYTKNDNSCIANTYQVNLNNEDATTSGSTSVTVTYEAGVPTITPPTKRGYVFGGYYTEENGAGTQYIGSNGVGTNTWDLTSGTTLYAKWSPMTITCLAGEYLPADATSCTTCPEGSGCPGGDYSFNETTPQGAPQCSEGTYSGTTGASSCTACSGGTNSQVGATTCGETCSNSLHVSTWSTACNIASCDTGYENSNNSCVARTFSITLDNQNADIAGSTSVTATYNDSVPSITIPEKVGYNFGGYYTEINGGGVRYIKEDGTSAKDWDSTTIDTLYAKWTLKSVTCSSGEYLPKESITCSNCTAGNYCVGGTYNYSTVEDQGINSCAVGSYSLASSSSCTMCSGNTTSGVGQTSCNASCSNVTGVATWNTPSWNNNSPTNVCSIDTCSTGYTLGTNSCVANELNFSDQSLNINYSSSSQTDNVVGATNGTGSYSYSKKSGDSDITVSSNGEITIPAGKNSGGYSIVITATDTISGSIKDATYDITINKLNASCTINTSPTLTYPGSTTGNITYTCTGDGTLSVTSSDTTVITVGTIGDNSTELTALEIGSSTISVSRTAGTNYNAATAVTSQVTVTGSTYTITLDNQSATTAGSTSITATYGSQVPSITVPTKTGYDFGGYYTSTNGEGTQYINASGTSARNWDSTTIDTLYAKWTIVTRNCSAGQYLASGSTTCSGCPAGSYCPGGVYTYSTSGDQGKTACAQGSYSAANSSVCTACTGLTTSGTGQTSCNASCSNESNVSTWTTATWSANTVSNLCTISTCTNNSTAAYILDNNSCVRLTAGMLTYSNSASTNCSSSANQNSQCAIDELFGLFN